MDSWLNCLPFILDTFIPVYPILQALPQKWKVGGSGESQSGGQILHVVYYYYCVLVDFEYRTMYTCTLEVCDNWKTYRI